jgi:hypothetical protein
MIRGTNNEVSRYKLRAINDDLAKLSAEVKTSQREATSLAYSLYDSGRIVEVMFLSCDIPPLYFR